MIVSEIITQLFGVETVADKAYIYKTLIGNGYMHEYTVTHNLNSKRVTVSVMETAGQQEQVLADVEILDENSLKVKFGNPVNTGEYTVVVIG